jgi:hypothetical protein
MFRVFSAFIFLIFLSSAIQAQQILLFETTDQEHIVLKAGDMTGQRNTDYIIYTLAIGNAKPLSGMQINVGFDKRLQFSESYGPFVEALLTVENIKLEGDIIYRQFDFTSLLIPDFVRAHLIRQPGVDPTPFEVIFSLQHMDGPLPVALIDNEWLGNAKPLMRIQELGYTDEATARFTEQVHEINNYWAAISLIDSLLTEIQKKRIDEIKSVTNLFIYWDLSRKVNLITAGLAEEYSSPATNGKLRQRHATLNRMQTRLSTLLTIAMEGQRDTLIHPYDFVMAFTHMLARQRSTSLQVEFQDAESFYRSGRLMPDSAFVYRIRRLEAQFNNTQASQLIYDELIMLGDRFQQNDDLVHTLDYYEDAQQLAELMQEIEIDQKLANKIIGAREGLLRAHFRIAARSIEAGNYKLAHEYEAKANDFWQLHLDQHLVDFIPAFDDLSDAYIKRVDRLLEQQNIGDAEGLLSKLHARALDFNLTKFSPHIHLQLTQLHRRIYLSYVVEAEKHYRTKSYTEAASELNHALIYRQHNIAYLLHSNEADELQRQIREPVVKQIIYQGIEAFKHGKHDQALGNFIMARDEIQTHALNLQYPLDSLTSLAAKPMLLQHIKSAHLKIWANDLDEAWAIYKNASMLRQSFSLNHDPDIKQAFDDLDQRFIQRICLSHQLRYFELIDRTERSIRNNTTDHLKSLLLEAIKLAADNPGCNIDPGKAKQFLEEYDPLFEYRKSYLSVIELFNIKLYNEAVAAYHALDARVAKYKLQHFNQSHTTLIDYIQRNSTNEIYLAALSQFIESGEAENALICLKLLRNGSYPERNSRNLQEQTAHLLAVYDFSMGLRNNPESKAMNHVGNDRWFKTFRQAYVDTINKLQQKP